ncbi:DUF1127 domain-containing protein [Variovorax ginsengisoli]|uniref:Uncharacterized protein YjiS (DUF1127 family) n=1 Tax=Variovorax ginsengisoli TaxID=363844 RepID=A0ABT9S5I0_9BURK|nr:DUF1127 domain-containing protein [Variovorax ginsengisoli]MDP9899616.1 uncharacterized protein YjiS (DUF1127 family) [Variovorax ginsengisoli]
MLFPSFPLLSSLRRALARLSAHVHATRRQARSRQELQGMNDQELMDLGLGRSQLPEWLRRRT